MVTVREEKKSRQQVAADNMTRAQRIARQLQSGPIKSELRTVQEAIMIASAFDRHAKELLKEKGLDHGKDFALVITYLTPDLSVLWTQKFVAGQENAIHKKLSETCGIMAGLIFGIREHDDAEYEWRMGARPFVNTPLVRDALQQRMESEVTGIQ